MLKKFYIFIMFLFSFSFFQGNITNAYFKNTKILVKEFNFDGYDINYISDEYKNEFTNIYHRVIVTKNKEWNYFINYITYKKDQTIKDIKREYIKLEIKNFNVDNLYVYSDWFIYIETTLQNSYFYHNNEKYSFTQDEIEELFNYNDKTKGVAVGWKQHTYKITNNNLYNVFKWQTTLNSIIKNFNFFFRWDTIFIFNPDIKEISEDDNALNNFYTKIYNFDSNKELIKDCNNQDIICWTDGKTEDYRHNLILNIDLNKKEIGVNTIKDVFYYDNKNTSNNKWNIIINNINWDPNKILLMENLKNFYGKTDKYVFYLLERQKDWNFTSEELFYTAWKGFTNISDNSYLWKKDIYNNFNVNRQKTSVLRIKGFILIYILKNKYKSLIVYNEKTNKITEFKDVNKILNIFSNYKKWINYLNLIYNKQVWETYSQNQFVKISENDNTSLKYAFYNWNVLKVLNNNFDTFISIVKRNSIFISHLGEYILKGTLLKSQNLLFFIDYIKNNETWWYQYISFLNKDITNILNSFIKKNSFKVEKITLLNNWYLLLSVSRNEDIKQDDDKVKQEKVGYLYLYDFKTFKQILKDKVISLQNYSVNLSSSNIVLYINNLLYLYNYKDNKLYTIEINNFTLKNSLLSATDLQIKWNSNKNEEIWQKTYYWVNNKNHTITFLQEWKIKIIIDYIKNKVIFKKDYNIKKVWWFQWYVIYVIQTLNNTLLYINNTKVAEGEFLWVSIKNNIIEIVWKHNVKEYIISKEFNNYMIKTINSKLDSYFGNKDSVVKYGYYIYKSFFYDIINKTNNITLLKNTLIDFVYKFLH